MLKAEVSFLLTNSPELSSQECLSANLKACDFWLSVWLAHSYHSSCARSSHVIQAFKIADICV